MQVDTQCRKLQLNSSGESETQSSPDAPTPPEHTPSSDDSSIDKDKLHFEFSLVNGCEEGRETHNLKERKRRYLLPLDLFLYTFQLSKIK